MSKIYGKITWIGSYPRSGNTWARFVVGYLLLGKLSNSSDIERVAPDVHRNSTIELPEGKRALLKYGVGNLFKRSEEAIYIVRNPLDAVAKRCHPLREDGGRKETAAIQVHENGQERRLSE